ncbi:PAS and ANTAR domain-containing protein [Mycobacterium kubicae]|uniref:PAS and ANTAR domain-containing protein n=1 Tax=Mycobacterium kubicae TaxID=120959 RepID=UPI0008020064|nr:PAS and ANTAR domain-containing protein [Mycobacterium kubicae]OBF17337.1 antitermination regulator [Mycobacterium kubicae]OBK47425.1 antitermination regulator [Mycobacterium kubicae]QNI07320.1 ANTAR domain-containing protein [Mycobacterium kubicae]
MTWDLDGQSAAVEQALAGGSPQRVGWFRFYFADQRWEWSDQVQQMHGYEPGTVTPTTELVLSHKHPDDRDQVAAAIADILDNRKAFSTRHRIIDTGGDIHHVVVVGDQLCDEHGTVIGSHGFYVDVSPQEQVREDMVTAKLAEITQNRAGIEQAKGMLMLVYGIDGDSAFNLLKWLSQESNVKLRPLAEQIVDDFRTVGKPFEAQSAFDQLLLTAHLRVGVP